MDRCESGVMDCYNGVLGARVFLTVWAAVLSMAWAGRANAGLAGTIAGGAGAAVVGARVFVEPGLGAPVVEGTVAADGSFTIEGEYYGSTGVFMSAPGCGWTGVHLDIAPGDRTSGLKLTPVPAAAVSGQVKDERGNPVRNARITALAITEPVKVGIPLFKLEALNVTLPVSDAEGRFTLAGVPRGAKVALKFEHPLYAQEAVANVAADEADLQVILYQGVPLQGLVALRSGDKPVSGATVMARNAQPPHDTAFSRTDGTGVFHVLLKPGVYMVQASAPGRIGDGWRRVALRGDAPAEQVRLTLSGKGVITGVIQNARSGGPVPGARVLLETQGRAAGATRTGADGRFRLEAPEGANTLHFEAVDGFRPPDTKALTIMMSAGEKRELPGLWLAPAQE